MEPTPVEAETDQEVEGTGLVEGDPVFVHNGSYYLAVKDFSIPAPYAPMEFTRSYRSQISYNGPLGRNWDFNFNKRIFFGPGRIEYCNGTGRMDVYLETVPGTFYPPKGFYDVFTANPDGTYTLKTRHGETMQFGPSGLIDSITTRTGLTQRFFYSGWRLMGIMDVLGRPCTFQYYPTGRIQRIIDCLGRPYTFSYDANDDLVSVTSPGTAQFPQGCTVSYTYWSGQPNPRLNHNLASVTDPKGQTYLRLFYDFADRVIQQDLGRGSNFFSYYPPQFKTVSVDRRGIIKEWYCVGNAPSVERIFKVSPKPGETPYFETRYTYNAWDEIQRIDYPEGNAREYVFDEANPNLQARGNLIIERHFSKGASPTSIAYAIAYEPRYNYVKTKTSPRGGVTVFYYDYEEAVLGDLNGDGITTGASGNLVRISFPDVLLPDRSVQSACKTFVYNALGQIVRRTETDGSVTAFEYFPAGDYRYSYLRKTTVDFGGLNLETVFDRDSMDNPTSVTLPNGNVTAFHYDALGRVTMGTRHGTVDRVKEYTYDRNGNLIRVDVHHMEENGNPDAENPLYTTEYFYDIDDKVVKIVEEVDNDTLKTTDHTRSMDGLILKTVSNDGFEKRMQYDERGSVISELLVSGRGDDVNKTMTYTENGKIGVISCGKESTSHFYDGFDRLIRSETAGGACTEYSYDVNDNIVGIKVKDGAGADFFRESLEYDLRNRIVKDTVDWIDSAGSLKGLYIVTHTRDKAGRLVSSSDNYGVTWSFQYDSAGRMIKRGDNSGSSISRAFDLNGNIVQESEELHDEVTDSARCFLRYIRQYNEFDELIAEEDAEGNVKRFAMDSLGRVVSALDARGNPCRYKYNCMGMPIESVHELRAGGTCAGVLLGTVKRQWRWDSRSCLVEQIDDKGNSTKRVYDFIGRIRQVVFPDGSKREISYNHENHVSKTVDPSGTTVDYTYDADGLISRKDVSRGAGVIGVDWEAFAHDALGRTVGAGNSQGIYFSRKLDSFSGIEEEDFNGRIVRFSYSRPGYTSSMSYSDGETVSLDRDAWGRLSDVRNMDGEALVKIKYLGPYQKFIERMNGIFTGINFDDRQQVKSIFHSKVVDFRGHGVSVPFSFISYSYDQDGNPDASLRSMINLQGGRFRWDFLSERKEFSYDSMSRLESSESHICGEMHETRRKTYELDGRSVNQWLSDILRAVRLRKTP